MAINVKIALYRGTKANLGALASTGQAGVMAFTTDSRELYVDTGSGTGIGPGNAWIRAAANNNVQTAANQAARLALSNVLLGDMCVQTDTGTTYVLTALPSSTNGNWTAIGLASAPVTSVAGRTGAVTLSFSDLSSVLTQAQLPASIGAGSNLALIDCGSF